MKFLHISDLHIGKRVHEFSMLEDQRFILEQILSIVTEEQTDGVLISGDVYDKSIPPAESVTVFDRFLTGLHKLGQQVFIISGNHDSSERLDFGRRLMEESRIFIAGSYQGVLKKITLHDDFGALNLFLLPFVKPSWVSQYYDGIETYQDAVEAIIQHAAIDTGERNLLLSHQFITCAGSAPETCESECLSIGGVDNVDVSFFEPFDYVALGHLHGPQRIGRDTVRYSGSPLKYSFSEALQKKSAVLIDMKEKGNLEYKLIPLHPRHDLRKIKGPISALLDPEVYQKADVQDYIHATLTDEDELYDAIGRLRSVYPNIMHLEFENSRTASQADSLPSPDSLAQKNPLELFEEFYQAQNNIAPKDSQKKLLEELFHQLERRSL